ncbi:MAG TPA: FeoA family protein [Kofleriaceae bacterium]|nr:FeoA family protein [Kofleriaceae bacterium]
MSSLAEAAHRRPVVIHRVTGDRGFRRRLMELGLVPGTQVTITNVAPLGDPIEIEVRKGRLSIRRVEAASVLVDR